MNAAATPALSLTPLLCLAASLLYMMKADGHIDDHESSQIQAVLGGNEEILELALEYVAVTPIEEFLAVAAPVLNQKEILCILTNVCDSFLSDGTISPDEKELFQIICRAFEVSEAAFAPYERALRFKNNKRKLGSYSHDALTSPFPPPHLALAACLLYMMSADGEIAEEEIGQLQVVIGEFEGLQEVAMQQVRCMKLSQFLRGALPYLNDDQKLFILVNVYDSMLSDGVVEENEQLLFDNMQDAFGIASSKLDPYVKAIEFKNYKPKVTQIDRDAIHTRKQRKEQSKDEWDSSDQALNVGQMVHRTLDQNIKQVSEGFNSQADIDLVAENAQNKDRRLKINEAGPSVNIQQVDLGAPQANIQTISTDSLSANRQSLDDTSLKNNRQAVDDDRLTDNLQSLEDDHISTQESVFFADARMDSLQLNITTVHQQLDLITPKSTWQKLDVFFKQRPLPLSELELESALVSDTAASDHQALSTEEIAEEGTEPASERQAEPGMEMAEDADSMPEAGSLHESATDFNAAHMDGGIRLRSLLLVVGISIPLVGFAYGLIYPTMTCQGPSHQWQKWTPDVEGQSTRVINEQIVTEHHLIQIRRGEVNVTNQRFPLYKELNQSNHFARQTDVGFQGSYSTHLVDAMNYTFEYIRDKHQLNIKTESAGIRYIDGQSGHIQVFTVFQGQCDNRWF